jgi:hypothetical protein
VSQLGVFWKLPQVFERSENFAEVCVRTVSKGHQDKLENKVDICLFVGYP